MMVKLPKVGNNLLQEMSPQQNCNVSKKHVLSTNWSRKEEQINFSTVKEYGRLVVFKFLFLFLGVFLFSLLVLSFFRGLSIISSARYFFVEAYPFKNICQMEIFVTVYLPKQYLLNKQFVSLCKVSKTLKNLKNTCLLY